LLNISLHAQICDLKSFLVQCPTEDPDIEKNLEDFELRLNGLTITDFPGYEPESDVDITDYTNPSKNYMEKNEILLS
jgi:hypothetical protein